MSQASDAHMLDSSSLKPELLTALPDVPTLAILSRLPLQPLIVKVPLVLRRLGPLRENVLKGKQRLVLHLGDQTKIKEVKIDSRFARPFARHLVDSTGEPLVLDTCPCTWSECDQLHLASLDHKAVEQLPTLMPAIVHLQVVISDVPILTLSQLAILLAYWAPTLQTLKLTIGQFNFQERIDLRGFDQVEDPRSTVSSNMRFLLQAINGKFVALQHLTLDIGNLIDDAQFADKFLFGGRTGVPLSLPILGQLREFNLDLGKCENRQSFLLDVLKECATEKLTSIGLAGNFDWNLTELSRSQFAKRFTLVPFNNSPLSNRIPLLRYFSNLTVYAFPWTPWNTPELLAHFRRLSPLSKLQYLKITSFSPDSSLLSIPDLPPLRSVTVLEINIGLQDNEHHSHLQVSYWETLFPSVQILIVSHGRSFCTICYPDDGWNARQVTPDYTQVAPCLRQLFAPLRVFPSLRKIFYQRNTQIDLIAEFTPQGEFVRTHKYI